MHADIFKTLIDLGATPRLITHLKLVVEAAEEILSFMATYPLTIDADFVRRGAAIHDAGKIEYKNELNEPGNKHELAGEQLLLGLGWDPKLARCCRSHAQYTTMECSIEELLIALADKLWKGKRESDLETDIIDRVATMMAKDRWDIFIDFDYCFEAIASRGVERLGRSE